MNAQNQGILVIFHLTLPPRIQGILALKED